MVEENKVWYADGSHLGQWVTLSEIRNNRLNIKVVKNKMIEDTTKFESELDIIDKKFNLAHRLFTKIYDEFINSEDMKEWQAAKEKWRNREKEIINSEQYKGERNYPNLSQEDKELEYKASSDVIYTSIAICAFNTKLSLLRAYLGLEYNCIFPTNWHYHEYWH